MADGEQAWTFYDEEQLYRDRVAALEVYAADGTDGLAADDYVSIRGIAEMSGMPLLLMCLIDRSVGAVRIGRQQVVTGENPFAGGSGVFFAQVGLYLVATAVGVLLRYLLPTTLGRSSPARVSS